MSAERLSNALAMQVRRFSRALAQARRGAPVGVHQARVASRRIREMLPLVEARHLNRNLRRLAASLGAVRELDVTRVVLADAAERHHWRTEFVRTIDLALASDRDRRHSECVDILEEVDARSLTRSLRGIRPRACPGGVSLRSVIKGRVQSRASALAATLGGLGTLYVPDRLHEVRLAAKKLRYSLEAQRDVLQVGSNADIATLTGVQEELGHLHDLQVLQARVRNAHRDADRSEVRRMVADLEKECRTLHARAVAQAPAWIRIADRLACR